MFVTVLLINLLIAIMNNTFEDWKAQATGMWALQFTELLHRFEIISFPPPFNIAAFIIYFIEQTFFANRLYCLRIFKHSPISQLSHLLTESSETELEKERLHPEHPVRYYELVSINSKNPSDDNKSSSMFYEEDLERQSYIPPDLEEPEEKKIIIQNLSDAEVGIKFGKHLNSWLYVKILPDSSVVIPKPPAQIPCWAVKYDKIDKIYCTELHPHYFKMKKKENCICSSCCVKSLDINVLICEQCSSYQLCLKCYYNSQIDTNTKRVKVLEKFLHQPESWWKRDQMTITQPDQSNLVKVIISIYLKDKSSNQTNQDK